MNFGVCRECGSTTVQCVDDTWWCADCGELVADTMGGTYIEPLPVVQVPRVSQHRKMLPYADLPMQDRLLLMRLQDGARPWRAPAEKPPPKRCSEEGCENPHMGLGLCAMHYHRARRAGVELREREPEHKPQVCSEHGCGGSVLARGLCSKHYQQDRRAKRRVHVR